MDRGFDAVTVAEVAREAGVSTVTVFNHFPSKEDLFLDRADDAVELLQAAVRDREPGIDVLESLRRATLTIVDERQPLSGVAELSIPYFRTVAASPALVARARGIAADLQRTLTQELEKDTTFEGDATLLAALFIAGYANVMVQTAGRLMAGEPMDSLLADHRERFERLFESLRSGVAL
jgi:AcrR family transcriptional regulator